MTRGTKYIDEVARRMTSAADDTPDFRTRTIAMIGDRRGGWGWWKAVPITSLAAVAVAVAVFATGGRDDRAAWPVPPPPAGTIAAVARPDADPMSASVAVVLATPRLASRTPAASPEEQLWESRRLAGLAGPAPIVTGEIQPAALAVPLLQLKPLSSEPLTIEPMDSGG